MTTLEAHGIEAISVVREDDELGCLILSLICEDGTVIKVNAGRFHDDATSLRDLLADTAKEIDSDILKGWEDRPDEFDAYVSWNRDGYVVSLEGMIWNGEKLVSHSVRPVAYFPTQDIATYELARAMTTAGCFPNAWFINDRGNAWNIAEEVRKYHDDGGADVLPLEGVEYERDTEIMVDNEPAHVVRDYGNLGVVYRLEYAYGAGTDHTYDRSDITVIEEEDSE